MPLTFKKVFWQLCLTPTIDGPIIVNFNYVKLSVNSAQYWWKIESFYSAGSTCYLECFSRGPEVILGLAGDILEVIAHWKEGQNVFLHLLKI